MARATRSKPKAKEPTPEPPVSTIKPLPASTSTPPKLFVLPKDASKDARIVTLENPATGAPSRYFFCPDKGFHEFTRIAAPKKECRSWLLTSSEEEQDESTIGSGYISQTPDLFLATPIDLLFLILPALAPKSAKDTTNLFLALDDYIDKLAAASRHWRALLAQHGSLRAQVEKRMRAVCDTVDAGDEPMFRLCSAKLLAVLLCKAERMVAHGLPASLEERYVKTALEIPIMTLRREESSLSGMAASEKDGESTDSQVSVSTTLTTPDESPAPKPALTTPPNIPHLLRLRTSLSYLVSSYLPTLLQPPSPPLFAPLIAHLSAIASLKSEAAALRSLSDNMSRKRAADEDDEKVAEREEKKRKKEDEDKRKKSEGRAVKALKKVDTSGMKKMSAFFGKAEKKKG